MKMLPTKKDILISPADIVANNRAKEAIFETTELTFGWLETTLQTSLNCKSSFGSDCSVEQIGIGQGYMSQLIRVFLDWQRATEEQSSLPESVILKMPSIHLNLPNGNNRKEMIANFQKVVEMSHRSEVNFYEMVKRTKELETLLVPRCFYTRNFCAEKGAEFGQGILILEDLCDRTFVKPIYSELTVNEIKQIIEQLCVLHAFSLQNPTCLKEADFQSTIARLNSLSNRQYEIIRRNMTEKLRDQYYSHFGYLIDHFLDTFSLDVDYVNSVHEQLNMPAVLIHGDCYMNNFLWTQPSNSGHFVETGLQLKAIIDWQFVHPGSVCEDLVRVLCSSTSGHIRRVYLDDLLGHYLHRLNALLSPTTPLPFNMDQLRTAYNRLFSFGVRMIVPGFINFLSPYTTTTTVTRESEGDCQKEVMNEERKSILLTRCRELLQDLYQMEK